jgi:alpha-L-fucosidase
MKLRPLLLSTFLLLGATALVRAHAAEPAAPRKDDPLTSPRTKWWREAKYGMFIHWGVYSVPAGYYHGQPVPGIGEWIMNNARIPVAEYEQFPKQFDPEKFDAREWARTAKAAGMKYMVITSKHHDGFSMFGTKVNPYNIVDATPYHRDPMLALSQACKDEGIKFGFYYSIMDWHNRYANAEHAGLYEAQMRDQLKELITNYDPAILWFDGEWVPWWTQEKGHALEAYLHTLKPGLVINNRIGKRKMDDGDYETPEQEIPKEALGKRLWETCMTLNDTWGYKRDDNHWKTPEDVVRKLADIAGKGGNFLLNVGPTSEGLIPAPSVQILKEAGQWVHRNGEAIYGTTSGMAAPPAWGSVTRKGDHLYLIVFHWPKAGEPLHLPLNVEVKSGGLLHGGGKVTAQKSGDGVDLALPAQPAEKIATVVKLEVRERDGSQTASR